MRFIIGGMKYNTDNMEKIADVKKWYEVQNYFTQALYPGKEVGRTYDCELWRSKKGNWLLTHEADYRYIGEAIEKKRSKSPYDEICNENLRRNVRRTAGSIKKRSPYCKGGDLKQ